jgi:site-specific DNA-cytosine methylase
MTLLPERILSGEVEAPDLFCGGTPCQAFSVAGLRNSLDDARGNLSLTFVGIANAIDHVRSVRRDAPAIIFWENVPGVLNTKDNAFGCFLGALAGENDPLIPSGDKWSNAGCVYGPQRTVAWRVLDAQYFGVAQRRRRVFVIASARDDLDPAKVLFEFEGVRRDTAPSRKEGQRPTTSTQDSPRVSSSGLQGGGDCGVDLSGPLSARDYKDAGTDGMNKNSAKMVPVMQEFVGALDTQCGGNKMSHQTIASGHLLPVKSFYESSLAQYREANVSGTIKRSGGVAGGGSETFLAQPIAFDLVQITSSTNRSRAEPGLPAGTISKSSNMHIAQPVAYSFDSLSSNSMKSENPNSGCNEVDVSRSLDTSRGLDPSCNQGGIGIAQPVAVYENHPADSRIKEMGEVCSTVTSRWGTGGGNMPIVSQPIPLNSMNCFRSPDADPSTGCGIGEAGEAMFTITKTNSHAVAQPIPIHDQATRHAGRNGEKTMGKGNGLGIGQEGDPMNTLTKGDRHAVAQPIAMRESGQGYWMEDDKAGTLRAEGENRPSRPSHVIAQPIAFEPGKLKRLGYGDAEPGLSPALRAEAGDNQVAVAMPIAFHPTQDPISSTDGTTHGLGCGSSGGQASIAVAHEMTIPIDSMNHLGRTNENHSMGDFMPGAPSYTLTKSHTHAVAHPIVLMDQGGGVMNVQTDGTTGTLRRETHGHEPVVMQPIPFQETADCLTAAYGTKWNGNASATNGSLFAAQPMSFDTYNQTVSDVSQTIKSPVGGANESIGTVLAPSLTTNNPSRSPQASEVTQQVNAVYQTSMAVRRLTPMECERLQGFPDGYTNIPWRKADESPDGPRYKALGNSWAVPVVRWIGERIEANLKENKT